METTSPGNEPVHLDGALLEQRDRWLHHPVLGDPSFDSFERLPCNPIHQGGLDFEWPVNCFLLREAGTRDLYAYISEYPRGYWPQGGRKILRESGYRSRDEGASWEPLGVLMSPEADSYEQGAATLDFHLTFAEGRYHVLYGWCDRENRDGGEGYAWASSPAGPFQRSPRPVTSELHSPKPNAKLQRLYAAGVFRRRSDWLLLGMMSTPGNAGGYWALVAATAVAPEGPYNVPVVLLAPDNLTFHHPLMEFFPYFEKDGYLYARATSVAANRTYQGLWRAELEQAHCPAAWAFIQDGSQWSWHPSEYEHKGIWGQTWASLVGEDGSHLALYPSKTKNDLGTINLARSGWMEQRARGFRLSAPNAPALTLFKQAVRDFTLDVDLEFEGWGAILLGHPGILCSDRNGADACVHPLSLTSGFQICFSPERIWVEHDHLGSERVRFREGPQRRLRLKITCLEGLLTIWQERQPVYEGVAPLVMQDGSLLGLMVGQGGVLDVHRFELQGEGLRARLSMLSYEALLGAAAFPETFRFTEEEPFRHGWGHLLLHPGARGKWNYRGRGFELWAPRGPSWGRAKVWVDGEEMGEVSFESPLPSPSAPLLVRDLAEGYHAVTVEAVEGIVPLDCLDYLV